MIIYYFIKIIITEVIKVIPICDEECKKNIFLAKYHNTSLNDSNFCVNQIDIRTNLKCTNNSQIVIPTIKKNPENKNPLKVIPPIQAIKKPPEKKHQNIVTVYVTTTIRPVPEIIHQQLPEKTTIAPKQVKIPPQTIYITQTATVHKPVIQTATVQQPAIAHQLVGIEPKITTLMAQPVIQPIERPVIQPIERPVIQPIAQPVVQPIVHQVAQPVVQPIAQPVVQPIIHQVAQPIAQPVVPPIVHQVAQPVAQPIIHQVAQPVAQPVVQPFAPPEPIGYVAQPAPQPIKPVQYKIDNLQPVKIENPIQPTIEKKINSNPPENKKKVINKTILNKEPSVKKEISTQLSPNQQFSTSIPYNFMNYSMPIPPSICYMGNMICTAQPPFTWDYRYIPFYNTYTGIAPKTPSPEVIKTTVLKKEYDQNRKETPHVPKTEICEKSDGKVCYISDGKECKTSDGKECKTPDGKVCNILEIKEKLTEIKCIQGKLSKEECEKINTKPEKKTAENKNEKSKNEESNASSSSSESDIHQETEGHQKKKKHHKRSHHKKKKKKSVVVKADGEDKYAGIKEAFYLTIMKHGDQPEQENNNLKNLQLMEIENNSLKNIPEPITEEKLNDLKYLRTLSEDKTEDLNLNREVQLLEPHNINKYLYHKIYRKLRDQNKLSGKMKENKELTREKAEKMKERIISLIYMDANDKMLKDAVYGDFMEKRNLKGTGRPRQSGVIDLSDSFSAIIPEKKELESSESNDEDQIVFLSELLD